MSRPTPATLSISVLEPVSASAALTDGAADEGTLTGQGNVPTWFTDKETA